MEAENAAGDEWGNEAFEQLLAHHANSSASAVRDAISEAVDAFVAEAPQKDDETLVIALATASVLVFAEVARRMRRTLRRP